jgi:acyl dehydratase
MAPRRRSHQVLHYKTTGHQDIGQLDDVGKMTTETKQAMIAYFEADGDDQTEHVASREKLCLL